MEIKATSKNTPNFECKKCYYKCSKKSEWKRHILSIKHTKNEKGNDLEMKSTKGDTFKEITDLYCNKCDVECSRIHDWKRHILTNKHLNKTNDHLIKTHQCSCGKSYKSYSGLWKHNKTCYQTDNSIIMKIDDDPNELKQLVVKLINENNEIKTMMVQENAKLQKQNYELLKQNQDFQKQVLDVCKNIKPSVSNSNNNNKTFNLQFFLNEQCKDAMNISDFINTVTLSLNDLERVGSLGYVEGISSIIIKELRNLDIYKRPMHCSDTKRETLYIKDENKWEKEDLENKKIKSVIRSVEHKNLKMISEWTREHTKYKGSDEIDNDKYLKIVLEAAGGTGDYEEKGNKIIKKLAKEIAIDK
jgi:hypothetical protein